MSEQKLTDEQIIRQDFVDNSIWNLINDLIPEEYKVEPTTNRYSDKQIPYDGDVIGRIRDLIRDTLEDILIPEPQSEEEGPVIEKQMDAFELAFYPYFEHE